MEEKYKAVFFLVGQLTVLIKKLNKEFKPIGVHIKTEVVYDHIYFEKKGDGSGEQMDSFPEFMLSLKCRGFSPFIIGVATVNQGSYSCQRNSRLNAKLMGVSYDKFIYSQIFFSRVTAFNKSTAVIPVSYNKDAQRADRLVRLNNTTNVRTWARDYSPGRAEDFLAWIRILAKEYKKTADRFKIISDYIDELGNFNSVIMQKIIGDDREKDYFMNPLYVNRRISKVKLKSLKNKISALLK